MKDKKKKTWGREVALLILLWFFYITESKGVEYTQILALPVFSFVFAAFGLKRLASDTSLFERTPVSFGGRRPQRGGEYTGGQGEYPDDRFINTTEVRSPDSYHPDFRTNHNLRQTSFSTKSSDRTSTESN